MQGNHSLTSRKRKTALTLALWSLLGSLPVLAAESGDNDRERPLVRQGVLGTVNVLRELDPKTWTNRVTVTSNVDDKKSNTVTFGASWDDTYLYVGVKVLDANLQKTFKAAGTAYMNDSVEVYVDPAHNRATAYDSRDRQFVKAWNDAAIYGTDTTGVLHGWAAITGGYTVELAIPWSNLGVTPSAKMTLGFDVGNNNSDGPCGRNTQLMWHGTDQNWQDTSHFGDLMLSAEIADASGVAVTPRSGASVIAKKTQSKLTIDGKLDEPMWHLPMRAEKVTCGGGNAVDTIDGSGKIFYPKQDGSTPLILTYTLPAPRTVSSLVIAYPAAGNDVAETVRLEGSADGGASWCQVFRSRPPRTSTFVKCFKPAAVNRLRLTLQDGGLHSPKEVFIYADPAMPLSPFGGKDSGPFSFLRDLWYAGRIKQFPSPENAIWTRPYGAKSFPHAPFDSSILNTHDGAWGSGEQPGKNLPHKRIFLRLDLDKAYPMGFGVIGTEGTELPIARQSRAELYTANGKLDPSTLTGSNTKDLTGQGWVLQKAWEKDESLCKTFQMARPGEYSQMLLVWDCVPGSSSWSHLEMFGAESPTTGVATGKQGGTDGKQ